MSTLEDAIGFYSSGQPRQAFGLAVRELPALLNVAAAAAYAQGWPGEAEKYWRLALDIKPDDADVHNNLGLLYADSGRFVLAEAAYRQALAAAPGHADACNNLAVLLGKLARRDEAEMAYRQALRIRPDYAAAHNNLGSLFHDMGRFPEAEAAFRQALAIQPEYAEAHYNLGILLAALNRAEEAEAAYRRALALRPAYAEAHSNLGVLLAKRQRHGEAEAAYRQALAARPAFAEAAINLGALLAALNRPEEAETMFRRALALRPGCVKASFNFALLLLSLGRFNEGWRLLETRYHPEQIDRRVFFPRVPFPQWQGEPLAGKSVLVWQEQGYGDEIQFCRLAAQLKARGAARVGLACKAPLGALLETLAGVDAVYPEAAGQTFPPYDYWTFLLSIPGHLGLDADGIPAALPYLRALPERVRQWQARLPAARPRIGLVWKGSGEHGNDACRSLRGLATLAPLWSVRGAAFISLQKGAGEAEALQPPRGQALTAVGQDIQDFADTAAIVAQLDLVICVDTAVAHLCGALGRPCWVLLPYVQTDWRWLRGREDSPWYPGVMRLFRQGQSESWADVAERTAAALRQWREDWPARERVPAPAGLAAIKA